MRDRRPQGPGERLPDVGAPARNQAIRGRNCRSRLPARYSYEDPGRGGDVANTVLEPSTRDLPAALIAAEVGGWIAGTVDIGSACLINSVAPRVILQAIASGLLGASSFHDGWPAALAGLVLQWAMSMLIAAVYGAGASRFVCVRRHPVWAGVGYGAIIYLVMNYVVVPLSAAPFRASTAPAKVLENLLAMILFGLIVAAVTQYARAGATAKSAAPAR